MRKKNFHNQKGRICGWWIDGIYRKKADPKKHLFKLMDAYGIDEDIVLQLKEIGTHEIRIMEVDTGRILHIPFEGFLAHGVVRNFDTRQRFVSRKYRKYFEQTKDIK